LAHWGLLCIDEKKLVKGTNQMKKLLMQFSVPTCVFGPVFLASLCSQIPVSFQVSHPYETKYEIIIIIIIQTAILGTAHKLREVLM